MILNNWNVVMKIVYIKIRGLSQKLTAVFDLIRRIKNKVKQPRTNKKTFKTTLKLTAKNSVFGLTAFKAFSAAIDIDFFDGLYLIKKRGFKPLLDYKLIIYLCQV